jgi:NAD(P)-dependent dehydrogenase (short-subunit alcohol dehydrogenase family)
MGRIDNKIVLVTGAGSGIGRAITQRFTAEGAHVIAADLNGSEEKLAAELPGKVTPYRCDVSDPAQIAAMFEFVKEKFPRLDILCNNAGIGGPAATRVHEIELADWDRVMGVNVRGFFLVLKHALALMLAQGGGNVVNTASIGGFRASRGSAAYITSKGAEVMLTRTAALDYATDNIRVNAVCPGVVNTPLVAAAPEHVRKEVSSRTPQGRLCEPEEVAALALFLASDEAPHITGQCYVIDGGRSAG